MGSARHGDDDDTGPEPESRTPDPTFGHQDNPPSGPSGTAADDQSAFGNHQSAIPEDPNPFLPDSATALRTVAERIWKRRRHFPRQARREGRQVMRLLTQAAQSPSPRTEQEAVKLFLQLLNILSP